MNNLQTTLILLEHQQETVPAWAKAERYDYCENKGFFHLFHKKA